ncbi:uncharacterized protein GIQ15_05927 [Arthroderma uncinatum]|uniref:uncharacterized protein n=1 Tax=Arthroderma uncinatum TaxID=74035 RepID=UPI00144ACC83|nr:uncharacterized protein GIQ15_05927 [Arthroderma uncinatum]KAF3480580.1 hypothetical protein GIQ15_05927 [Arthroderma uncinatum]
MEATISSSPARASPDLAILRSRLPYVNYDSSVLRPDNHAHPHQPSCSAPWRTLKPIYGSRHIYDVAEFSLWCEDTAEFKLPTPVQANWVMTYYRAKEVRFEYPVITVVTDTPPNPLTLTIAGVAARFVSDTRLNTCFSVDTAYASPRVPDPVPVQLQKWLAPTKSESDLILASLAPLCNVKGISWYGIYCYVELHTGDGRSYERHSLPGRVAGKTTTYHHSESDFWDEMQSRVLSRRIQRWPSETRPDLQDRTDYLLEGSGVLRPGVCIANSLHPDGTTSADSEQTTSCGIRMRHQNGQVVVTVSNHGVKHCRDVYHPSTVGGSKIGEVVDRWETQDVAMVNLMPGVHFSNNEYFQATAPKHLVKSDHILNGTWCSCDGISTGLIFLQCHGARISDINMGVTGGIQPEKITYRMEKLYSSFGPLDGTLSDGICGAPIVKEGDLDGPGGVCGLFRFGNKEFALSPVLDNIIDAGWALYDRRDNHL